MSFNLWRALGPVLNGHGTHTTTYQQIDNVHKFILNNVPYGHVDPNIVQLGIIEVDGPAQDIPNAKKPLQWHFGGEPYPIIKAFRIEYTYTRPYQGSDVTITASLFIGFEDIRQQLSESVLNTYNAALTQGLKAPPTPTTPLTLQNLIDLVDMTVANDSNTVNKLALVAPSLDVFIQNHYPYRSISPLNWESALDKNSGATPTPLMVEFDGPAQAYNSFQPFSFTLATLFNDQEKWNQLLWWYFGGKAFRVTKAMRVHLAHRPVPDECLWIGFAGPNDYGSGNG